MPTQKQTQLVDLFARFVAEVPITTADVEAFRHVRQTATRNVDRLPQITHLQDLHVEQILLTLLPYANTAANRQRGAWIHWSPAIQGELRAWYEASGWTDPSDWPHIARSIVELVRSCVEHDGTYADACREFSRSSFSKGFQIGTITPILNALRPDKFLLINNRIRAVLNYFAETTFRSSLEEYAAANDALHALLAQIEATLAEPLTGPLSLADRFDLFAEWLLVDQKFALRAPSYWRLQIGDDAWAWRAWQEGNFVAIGWDELGDLGDVKKTEFAARRDSLVAQYGQKTRRAKNSGGIKNSGWTKSGANQAWNFARQIHEGDQVLICRGAALLLGVATVAGPYYYVAETPQGHRLPVEWIDRTPRVPAPTQSGSENVLARLDAAEFAALTSAPSATDEQVKASLVIEATNGTPPAYLRFCTPLIDTLREQPTAVAAGDLFAEAIARAKVSKAERAQLAPTGSNPVRGQLNRARQLLAHAKLIESPQRGTWRVTPAGETTALSSDTLLDLHKELEYERRIAQTLAEESPRIRRLAEALPTYTATTPPNSDRPPLTNPLEQLAAQTYCDEADLATWLRTLRRKKQLIFYGPPGTGKTHLAQAFAHHLAREEGSLTDLVQFHPAYAYEDFIQGIRPQTDGDSIQYRLVSGHFLAFCAQAKARRGPCVLIIDEINRANLASVFGELMYLLEYRNEAIQLAAGGEPFCIPENVHLIGTMNTADRSIALVDHALRRRFAFIGLAPNYALLRRFHEQNQTGFAVDALVPILQQINERIADKQYSLGHTYFLRQNLRAEIADIWQMEIEPYLEEFFFDQPERVEEFRWAYVCERMKG